MFRVGFGFTEGYLFRVVLFIKDFVLEVNGAEECR